MAGYGLWMVMPRSESRGIQLLLVGCTGLFVLAVSVFASSEGRGRVRALLSHQGRA
jgi:hypothetical protein